MIVSRVGDAENWQHKHKKMKIQAKLYSFHFAMTIRNLLRREKTFPFNKTEKKSKKLF